ncbi:MAG: TIGR01212 family radical SAM protein [Clostridium sp.]|nr:TIGR01212 family radical SAM protein [Clostridium sp.]
MKPYRDFADFLGDYFPGKMQKLSVNAGFTCPNRDGTVGRGGCTYCNNQTFSPGYCAPAESVASQLEAGKRFFARKYPAMRYLAYFQSYTNTHGALPLLRSLYREALAVDGVDGLIIGTRPDSMPETLLDLLEELASQGKFVMVEYGAESSHNDTLRLINRCHTWECTADAVVRTAERHIPVGLHLINGLPGENEERILQTVDQINLLPVSTVKFHQLQLVRGTRMAADVEAGRYDIPRYTVDEYIALCCRIVGRLRRDIAVERFVSQSPADLLIYPRWGLKNHEFTDRLRRSLLSAQ